MGKRLVLLLIYFLIIAYSVSPEHDIGPPDDPGLPADNPPSEIPPEDPEEDPLEDGEEVPDTPQPGLSQPQAADQANNISAQGETRDFLDENIYATLDYNGIAIGDPVKISTGCFTTRETDIRFSFGEIDVEIARTYQSDRDSAHGFGSGWSFNYETRIIRGVKPNAEKIARELEELFELAPYLNIFFKKEMAREEAYLASINQSKNIYSLNATDPAYVQYTGNGTLTLIDEEGTPHLYTIKEDPHLGRSKPYPNGSLCVSSLPSYDSLQLLPDRRYLLVKRDGQRYVYSTYGLLSSITDRNGNRLSFLYSGGKLVQVQDSYGRSINLSWTGNRIVKITDPQGRDVKYTYDSGGRLSSRTDQEGNTVRYSYEGPRITYIQKPDGSRRSYFYTPRNGERVVERTVDEEGQAETFNYYNGYTEYRNASGILERHYYNSKSLTTRVVFADGSFEQYAYDNNNNLVRLIDRRGYSHTYAYDSRGNRTRSTDPDGNVESWSYSSLNKVTSYTDKMGRNTRYVYDGKGNLLKTIYPDSTDVSYRYDSRGRVTEVRDEEGSLTSLRYDEYGHVSLIGDAEGHEHRFEHDRMGNRLVYTGPLGNKSMYEYDRLGRLIKVTDPAGSTNQLQYSNRNDLTARIDQNGRKTVYVYNRRHELVRTVNPLGEATEYRYRGDGKVTEKRIGEMSRTVKRIGEMSCTVYGYDSLGNLSQIRREILPQIRQVGEGIGEGAGAGVGERIRWQYGYDRGGNVTTVLDPEGNRFEYGYDSLGRVVRISYPDGTFRSLMFNPNGMVVAERDESGNTTTFLYNSRNRLTAKIDPEGNRTEYTYNRCGRLARTMDARGYRTEYSYDGLNRLIRETDPLGYPVVRAYDPRGYDLQSYDSRGNDSRGYDARGYDPRGYDPQSDDPRGFVSSIRDKRSHETRYFYDSSGRLEKILNPLGDERQLFYDPVGNLIKIRDEEGHTTHLGYDALNRVVMTEDSEGGRTEYEYNLLGLVSLVKDPLGNRRQFEYDGLGRLIKKISASGNTVCYKYDGLGNLVSVTDETGHTTRYQYDWAGRQTERINPAGERLRYFYDERGNLTGEQIGDAGIYRYEYDRSSRLIREVNRLGREKRYSYDPVGSLLSVRDFNGNVTRFTYDALNRQNRVELPDGSVKDLEWDPAGNLKRAKNENREDRFAYDKLNRLVEAHSKNLKGSRIENRVQYGYDRAGNRILQRVMIGGKERTTRFRYDGAYRVTSMIDPEQTVTSFNTFTSFQYDEAGNLLSCRYPNKTVSEYVYNSAGQVESLVHYDESRKRTKILGSFGYVYDEAGRRIFQVDGVGEITGYRFDPASRLQQVFYPYNGGKKEDALAERIVAGLETNLSLQGMEVKNSFPQNPRHEEKRQTARARLIGGNPQSGTPQRGTPDGNPETTFTTQSLVSRMEVSPSSVSELERIYNRIRVGGQSSLSLTETLNEKLARLWKESYSYDGASNIVERRDLLGTLSYRYDEENRLTQLGSRRFEYDGNGNMIRESTSSSSKIYNYSAENRLVGVFYQENSVKRKGRSLVRYSYDSLGRKVLRERYSNDGSRIIEREYIFYDGLSMNTILSYRESSGIPEKFDRIKEFYYIGRNLLQVKELEALRGIPRSGIKSQTFFYPDMHGSPSMVMRKAVKEVSTGPYYFKYDAYGRLISGDLSMAHNVGFSGKPVDPVTGFSYFGYRHYSAFRKQWITPDPIRDGPNWYLYCAADPVNYIDPLGLMPASDRAAGGRGSVMEFFEGNVSISYQDGTVVIPEIGDVVPDTSRVTIGRDSYAELVRDPYQIQLTEPGTYSIPEEIAKHEGGQAKKERIRHQKIRGSANIIAGTGEIIVGGIVGAYGILSGDDALPAAGCGWIAIGIQNIGFGVNDLVSAIQGREVKDPDGPLPSLYIDW